MRFTCQCRVHRFDPWSRKIPHAKQQLNSMSHNYWACDPGPASLNYWVSVPRACAPQEKPTHCRAAPACHNWRKPTQSDEDPDKNRSIYLTISTKQEQIHRHREQTGGCQGGGGEWGKDWACGISRWKLVYTESASILLLGVYLGKTLIQKDTCTSMYTKALFTTARICKQHKCPSIDEWIKIRYWLPWWSSGQDSALSMQEAGGQSLVKELDPTCHN